MMISKFAEAYNNISILMTARTKANLHTTISTNALDVTPPNPQITNLTLSSLVPKTWGSQKAFQPHSSAYQDAQAYVLSIASQPVIALRQRKWPLGGDSIRVPASSGVPEKLSSFLEYRKWEYF